MGTIIVLLNLFLKIVLDKSWGYHHCVDFLASNALFYEGECRRPRTTSLEVSARRSPVAPLVRGPGAGAAPNCFSDRRRSITTHLGSVLHFLASPVYLSDCSPPPIYPTSKDHLDSETTLRFRTKRIPSFCSRTAKYDVCDTKT